MSRGCVGGCQGGIYRVFRGCLRGAWGIYRGCIGECKGGIKGLVRRCLRGFSGMYRG